MFFSLVIASLLAAGCVNTPSDVNQTPTSSTATHDAFLEKYLAAFKNVTHSYKNQSYKVWEITWTNSTSARLQYTYLNTTTNATWTYDVTLMVFPTSQDATNYLDAMNKTAYSLASTEYTSGGAFQNVTGHAPAIYKDYVWNEGNPFNISEYKGHGIDQLDNIIWISTAKRL